MPEVRIEPGTLVEALDALAELHVRAAVARPCGDRLVVQGYERMVSETLQERLRATKMALLAVLDALGPPSSEGIRACRAARALAEAADLAAWQLELLEAP